MKKQYIKPEIEVYDLEDVPMVLCSSPGVNYDGNITKPSSSSDIEYEDAGGAFAPPKPTIFGREIEDTDI